MPTPASRRTFLKTAATAAAAAPLVAPAVRAGGSDVIKVGLVGAGGRGRGAAADCLNADPNTRLVAICDIFEDFCDKAADALSDQFKGRAELPKSRRFHGFDGYKQLIDTAGCDLVLLCTPPGFRPQHLAHAVAAGKHVFAEKPLAVDGPGIRSVLASAKLAKEKHLMCASGYCYRYDHAKRETVKRIHGGQIGDVSTMHVSYNTGTIWHRGRKPEWSETEYQIRNWYYFTWLSGDHIVEQHCHNMDKAAWVLGELPAAATGLGGRQVRTDPMYGNIWDHFSVVFEYASGKKLFSFCRQMPKCENEVSDYVYGSKGVAELMSHSITVGGSEWRYDGKAPNMYVQEHREMLTALRAGTPINDMESAAMSSLMGILGRQAAYTGKRLTWKQMLLSKEDTFPKTLAWGPNPVAPVPMPGQKAFA
jgi:predicted dehydrogenase